MSRDARGRFLPGYDPDRHRLTRRDRRRGYRVMLGGGRNGQLSPQTIQWVAHKVQRHYRHPRGKPQCVSTLTTK
jgi:hypothetical protein